MAEDSMMKLEVDVPVMSDGVVSVPQFGMRYPDGTIVWGADRHGGRDIPFRDLAGNNGYVKNLWNDALKERAERCKIELAAYKSSHQLLRRTVFIGTTKPEDVTLVSGVSESAWK